MVAACDGLPMKIAEKQAANISVASVCALFFIWVLPETIALRHVLLFIGCIAGIFLIKAHWVGLLSPRFNLIPLYSIAALFFWVGIHYYFFSLDPGLELSEIKGLWLRSLAGCVMAMGFAIAIYQQGHLRKYFYIAILSVPLINVLTYIYDCYLFGSLVNPNNFVKFY